MVPAAGATSPRSKVHTAGLAWSKAGARRLIIGHTGVLDALSGKGARQTLVKRAAENARAAGVKIMPLCPFAKAQIEKQPEWQDVLT